MLLPEPINPVMTIFIMEIWPSISHWLSFGRRLLKASTNPHGPKTQRYRSTTDSNKPKNSGNETPTQSLSSISDSPSAINAAIVNAIAHATGLRFRELPVTAEKVRAALVAGRVQEQTA